MEADSRADPRRIDSVPLGRIGRSNQKLGSRPVCCACVAGRELVERSRDYLPLEGEDPLASLEVSLEDIRGSCGVCVGAARGKPELSDSCL